jgi:hypothetical protein
MLRIPFTSRMLFHHDSANFALALERYDLSAHQPHPPGYFLYVMLGKVVHLFVADANAALVSISIFFSAFAVLFLYLLGREMYDEKTALAAAFFALASPNLWFHAEVALSYAADAFFSAAAGYLAWKLYRGSTPALWIMALLLAVAGGFRQSTLIFLFPLWLAAAWLGGKRDAIVPALVLMLAACAAWLAPMVLLTGGMSAYCAAFQELWQWSSGHQSVFEKGWPRLLLYGQALAGFTLYGLGGGLVVAVTAGYAAWRKGWAGSLCGGKRWFYAVWILPSCLFYLLVFIHPANPGYALVFLPPLILLSARGALLLGNLVQGLNGRSATAALVLAVTVANGSIFLGCDNQVSWSYLRRHDRELAAMVQELDSLDPGSTALVIKPYLFHGFRLFMYYLPRHTVYLYEPGTTGQRQTFWGTGRRTFLSKEFALPPRLIEVATVLFEEGDHPVARVKRGPAAAMMKEIAASR